ncbi:hypothetical protein ALC60_11972 [Trachymyrmex zeteki]|uniref:Uncharacterized protein n=1 Tax=Mycetomoellerius zeteki TaxID=64791 RepID=A0A151WM73_9HYME|nr:hypothetical protein ALC60_11972 [Trachymyrmex zeteki]
MWWLGLIYTRERRRHHGKSIAQSKEKETSVALFKRRSLHPNWKPATVSIGCFGIAFRYNHRIIASSLEAPRIRRIGKRERGSCDVTGNCRQDESRRNPVSDFVGNLRSRSRHRNIYGEKVIRYNRKKVAIDANTSRQSLQKYRGIELLIRDDDGVASIVDGLRHPPLTLLVSAFADDRSALGSPQQYPGNYITVGNINQYQCSGTREPAAAAAAMPTPPCHYYNWVGGVLYAAVGGTQAGERDRTVPGE